MRGVAGGGRRRPKESFNPQPPPPPTPLDHQQLHYHRQLGAGVGNHRDSDASFASSRPSSIGVGRSAATTFDLYKDNRYQESTMNTINAYLASHSSTPLFLKYPYPSAKDITQTLTFLMTRLDFPSPKIEDLPLILKSLNYPFKLNKSILKSPGTPHQWPTFLAIIHWLFQVAVYNDHLSPENTMSFADSNPMQAYTLSSYSHFIRGDDDSVEELDREWLEKLEREKENAAEVVTVLEKTAAELEAKAAGLKSAPSRKEELEKEKELLEADVGKFHGVIEKLVEKIGQAEKDLVVKQKELEEKMVNNDRIRGENEELKRRVELQTINSRDVERMKRELQAVERDIGEAENSRNSWEEKTWDLEEKLGHKYKEIEALAMDCNVAMRRLKFLDGFQYALNANGSTPAEIMGIDYKSKLKPVLKSFGEDIKKNSVVKLEESISLQQQLTEISAKVEEKRNHIAKLQSHCYELEAQVNSLKKEINDYTESCAADAKKMVEDFEMEAYNLKILEREAADILKASKLKFEEAVKQSEEEVQKCAYELIALIDSVSKYKEYMQSKISEMKNDVSETAAALSNIYKSSLTTEFGNIFQANR
ncbi:kinetochore protein NDC80 homolog [Ziziphus jujuba]|uniref:Kinetochore protein NDC80 n=1 Tax=Ziziphus jujuba TaxID=326968 RepID=A0A6P4AED8_ZIZJJ|nr:kinetochore protein NDC80 homolog [Ziziphus jujuba]